MLCAINLCALALLVAVLVGARQGEALYHDQVGVVDWHRALVGAPSTLLASAPRLANGSQSGAESLRLFVATERNVLASVEALSGSLVWRHQLGASVASVALCGATHIAVLTATPEVLVFEQSSGFLADQRPVSAAGDLYCGSLPNGTAWVVVAPPKQSAATLMVSLSPLDATAPLTIPLDGPLWAAASSGENVTLHHNGKCTSVHVPSSARLVTPCLRPPAKKSYEVSIPNVGSVWGQSGEAIQLLRVGALQVESLGGPGGVIFTVAGNPHEVWVEETGGSVSRVNLENGQRTRMVLPAGTITANVALAVLKAGLVHGLVEQITIAAAPPSKAEGVGLVSVVTADGSWHCLEARVGAAGRLELKLLWSRPEALAHTTLARFVLLPTVQSDGAQWRGRFWAPMAQLLKPLAPTLSFLLPDALLPPLHGDSSAMAGDRFGFRQLIVAAVERPAFHGVAAVFADTGALAWQLQFDPALFRRCIALFVKRVASPTEKPVVGAVAETADGFTVELDIDAGSGRVLREAALGVAAANVAAIVGVLDGNRQMRPAIVGSSGKLWLGENVGESPMQGLKPFAANASLAGLLWAPDAKQKGTVAPLKTWQMPLPREGRVAAVASNLCGPAAVASAGKVLDDRSVVFKYLNPNLVAVAVAQTAANGTTAMRLTLLDGATGATLWRTIVNGVEADAPVHLLVCENWVAAVFTASGHAATTTKENLEPEHEILGPPAGPSAAQERRRARAKARAQKAGDPVIPQEETPRPVTRGPQVLFAELYESGRPDTRAKGPTATPTTMAATYSLAERVSAVGVTLTRRGVATRELLLATPGGPLFAVRRPQAGWTATAAAPRAADSGLGQGLGPERARPLPPVLALLPQHAPSHRYPLLGVAHIGAAPTLLESTSLVLARGLDWFVARRTPSQRFDELSESFSKATLLFAVVGLSVGVLVLRRLVHDQQLSRRWA